METGKILHDLRISYCVLFIQIPLFELDDEEDKVENIHSEYGNISTLFFHIKTFSQFYHFQEEI